MVKIIYYDHEDNFIFHSENTIRKKPIELEVDSFEDFYNQYIGNSELYTFSLHRKDIKNNFYITFYNIENIKSRFDWECLKENDYIVRGTRKYTSFMLQICGRYAN